MKKLVTYLNGLSRVDQECFAGKCNTSVGYLRKACSVGQVLAPITCVLIERHSHCAVTRKDLRPDDWQDIWPELVNSDQKQPLALSQQAQGAINSEVGEAAHA